MENIKVEKYLKGEHITADSIWRIKVGKYVFEMYKVLKVDNNEQP